VGERRRLPLYKKKFPGGAYEKTRSGTTITICHALRRCAPFAPSRVEGLPAEHPALLLRVDFNDVSEMARSIIERYERCEIGFGVHTSSTNSSR